MKNVIFALLVGFVATVSADPLTTGLPDRASDLALQSIPVIPAVQTAKQAFFYIRFAAVENDVIQKNPILPGLGIGYRRLAGNGAADISVNGIGQLESKHGRVFWTAPKTSYIHYFNPRGAQSPYLGAGLAWGGAIAKKPTEHFFVGIIPSITAGFEFARHSVLGFAELNVSQPAISVYQKGKLPGPLAECTAGIGF